MDFPQIIQGGMGIGVSGWKLAHAVASAGQLGVISGICLDEILVRRLQLGDPGGHVRYALEHFPVKEKAAKIINRFFNEKGKKASEPFINLGPLGVNAPEEREDLLVAGGFTEVFLAKEGHSGVVGVNLLEKIQIDCLSTLYGCMLAGVDYVTMGAGIPKDIPGALDRLSQNLVTHLKLTVTNALDTDNFKAMFDPSRFGQKINLSRPKFLAVISSHILAMTLAKKSNGKVDGFIVETVNAGGHNAPSRSSKELTERGEPIYGARDEVDLAKLKELGIPFWLGGDYSAKGKLKEAKALGAVGVQVGTPFMLSAESGVTDEFKKQIFASAKDVFTDPKASPTGFPFKVTQIEGSLSEADVYNSRPRVCNFGYLRERYRKDDGSIGERCPAESVAAYVAKGGAIEATVGSKCLCNALFANIGMPNVYKTGYIEPPLFTAGSVLSHLDFVKPGMTAAEIVRELLED